VKKLFVLLAVVSLAAIGCDDKKSTGKPSSATTGGTYEKKDTVRVETHATVTNTVVQHTAVLTDTKTVAVTKTVDAGKKPADGPGLPKGDK
jgi:hypothetical protein